MKKIYNPEPITWSEILKRPTQSFEDTQEIVKQVFNEVKRKGDRAVSKYTSYFDGIILNAAAYTHTSVGIGDAIKAIAAPVIEVHISNTFSREDFRHTSFVTPNAKGLILGFGLDVYRLAIESFLPKF